MHLFLLEQTTNQSYGAFHFLKVIAPSFDVAKSMNSLAGINEFDPNWTNADFVMVTHLGQAELSARTPTVITKELF